MDLLEKMYEGSQIKIGEEVEKFAYYLDDCIMKSAASAEKRATVFALVDRYYEYAKEKAEQQVRSGRGDSDESNDMELDDDKEAEPSQWSWEDEAQTWDLLRRILPLRYRDKAGHPQPNRRPEAPPQSRREYWADFMAAEPKAREKKAVLEWLQRNASKGPPIDQVVQDLERRADRGEILAHGWLHTRGALKQHKRLIASSDPLAPNSRELDGSKLDEAPRKVTQLDPDVARRQAGRSLERQDEYFEESIWLGCYELLRRGKSMSEIRDWCAERTELWRAASFSALPLSEGDDEDVPYFDPSAAVLWRRMCARLAQESGAGSIGDGLNYERAVYGILSGDMSSVESVCDTWDDCVFAKYNAELRAQFDAFLIKQCDPDAIRSMNLLHSEVISHIDSRDRDDRNRRAANTPPKALQSAILEDRLDSLLYQQGLRFAEAANDGRLSKLIPLPSSLTLTATKADDDAKFTTMFDHHGLRILTHIYIIISILDKLEGKDSSALGYLSQRHEIEENSVAAYTSYLRLGAAEHLIPLYSSRLIGDRRYSNLSRNLIHVDNREVQMRLLNQMHKFGLDVVKFVKGQPLLFLSEIHDPARDTPPGQMFRLLDTAPPSLKYGRLIHRGIFGVTEPRSDDSEEPVGIEKGDELLVRSLEWLLLVEGLVLETCDFAVRIYKYFFSKSYRDLKGRSQGELTADTATPEHQRLAAAHVLAERVPCSEIIRLKTGVGVNMSPEEKSDPAWWDEAFSNPQAVGDQMDEDWFDNSGASKEEVAAHARTLWELECLVCAMKCLEDTAQHADEIRQ